MARNTGLRHQGANTRLGKKIKEVFDGVDSKGASRTDRGTFDTGPGTKTPNELQRGLKKGHKKAQDDNAALPQSQRKDKAQISREHSKPNWKADAKYTVRTKDKDGNQIGDATYHTDANKRVVKTEIRDMKRIPEDANPKPKDNPDAYRNQDQQSRAGGSDRLETDAGGHSNAREVGGTSAGINYTAMDHDLNSNGQWRDLEERLLKESDAGKKVDVEIAKDYSPGNSTERPDAYAVRSQVTDPDTGKMTEKLYYIRNQ